MKKFLIIFYLLLAASSAFSQTLVDEFEPLGSDKESARIDMFITELRKAANSKGLMVIYVDKNGERLGNVLGQIKGIKHHLSLKNFG